MTRNDDLQASVPSPAPRESPSRRAPGAHLLFRLLLVVAGVLALASSARADSAFTYQGSLTSGGTPANGPHDFEFGLWDGPTTGGQVGTTILAEDVVVSNGVFTVPLDFGAGSFPGAARWLEIGVRPGADTGAFTTLSPRRAITASPYAITADTAIFATTAGNAATADLAADSEKLDGLAPAFYLVGAESANGGPSFLGTTPSTIASLEMNAPTGGFVVVLASIGEIDVQAAGATLATFAVQVSGSSPTFLANFIALADRTFVLPMRPLNALAPSGTFTISLLGETNNASSSVRVDAPSLFAIWIPTAPGEVGLP